MLRAKVPHLDPKTRSKSYKLLQNVYLTLMQALGIVTLCVGLWMLLRLRIGVSCEFLNGFYSASIFLMMAGALSIIISTAIIIMIMRGKVVIRFRHFISGFFFVIVLEMATCVNATVDHYILFDGKFQRYVQQDFAEFSTETDKDPNCWTGLQKKFSCCGENNIMDWLDIATNMSSTENVKKALESCICDGAKRRTAKCTEFNNSASNVPFNTSLSSIYSASCYQVIYSFIDYQCVVLRAYGACLVVFQLVNLLAILCFVKKMNATNAVQNVYMVSFDREMREKRREQVMDNGTENKVS